MPENDVPEIEGDEDNFPPDNYNDDDEDDDQDDLDDGGSE